MRRLFFLSYLLVLSLAVSACGGKAPDSASAQADQTQGNGLPGFGNQDPNAPLPLASALAVGTIKLDSTDQAITPDEAKQLIPLWQGLQSLMSSDTTAQAEIQGVIDQIQSTMTAEQVSAIKAMNLTGSDEASVFGQGGFAFGRPGAQGTPQANGTPDANGNQDRFRGNFRGGGGGFAFRGSGFPGSGGPGGPGGFSGGGLPGAGGNNNDNGAFQSQRATAQARFAQFEQLGVNPMLVRAVISYLQGLSS
jgi:hypothetical protein